MKGVHDLHPLGLNIVQALRRGHANSGGMTSSKRLGVSAPIISTSMGTSSPSKSTLFGCCATPLYFLIQAPAQSQTYRFAVLLLQSPSDARQS